MAPVRERWLSGRALSLHLAVLVIVPACALAAWWQINRAADGNQLSYLYSVMWPVFGLLGIYFWWMLIHTDFEAVGLKGMQRQQAEAATAEPAGRPTRLLNLHPSSLRPPTIPNSRRTTRASRSSPPRDRRHGDTVSQPSSGGTSETTHRARPAKGRSSGTS